MRVLQAVEEVNADQKLVLYRKLVNYYGSEDDLRGKTVALWGLAFKPETDDMREAPSLVLINLLLKAGATIRVYDPVAMDECRRRIGDAVTYANDMYDAADGADTLMLVTEWKEFRMPNMETLKSKMQGRLVLDGRNILDADELRQAGFEYHCIGR
jgi:UDPglucose 6-dehydrogenase